MANIDIDSIISDIEDGVGGLAGDIVPGFVSDAEKDAGDFLPQIKADLAKWSAQFVSGQISEDDLSNLLKGDEELLSMDNLRKAGTKQAQLDAFKAGLFSLIEKVVTALI